MRLLGAIRAANVALDNVRSEVSRVRHYEKHVKRETFGEEVVALSNTCVGDLNRLEQVMEQLLDEFARLDKRGNTLLCAAFFHKANS